MPNVGSAGCDTHGNQFAGFVDVEILIPWHHVLMCPELDALGDEFLMDDDSSYLDEASTAPSIPEGLPGEKSTNRVLPRFMGVLISLQSCL